MLRKGLVAVVCGAVGIAIGAGVFSSASARIAAPKTVHVVEHALTDKVIDLGRPGDSTGDILTFHNPVFDATDSTKAGRDQGVCVRIFPKIGTWECKWITYLGGGHITVEGPFSDHRDTVLAITGGTGGYKAARGQMMLKARAGGTKYDFIFEIV